MEFSIKYKPRDYLAAVKFKMNESLMVLKTKKKYKYEVLFIRLFSSFIIFGIVIYAWFKKLRANYKFILSPNGMTRFTNDRKESVAWSRFNSYKKTENFILLQLDKDEGENDGQVLFPKRCFSEIEWFKLIDIFEENNIVSGEIELNMGI